MLYFNAALFRFKAFIAIGLNHAIGIIRRVMATARMIGATP